jgi:SAM-dependent methyltransferase
MTQSRNVELAAFSEPGASPGRAVEIVGASTGGPCPACEATSVARYVDIPDHEYALSYVARYAHCGACKTVYQSPMPDESQLGGFYPPSYHSMVDGGWLMQRRRAMRANRLKKLVGTQPSVVLDYGCGNGSFLVTAARQMPEHRYVGFEYSETPSREEREDGKVLIVRGQLSHLTSELDAVGKVGVLIMNHVVEHLPDPSRVLRGLAPHMAEGAIFDGQTPNADSLEHHLFGSRWSGYHAPRHTVVFSRRGLGKFMVRHGYAKIAIRGAFNPAGVAVSLGTLPQRNEGLVVRAGLPWFALVAVASALMPIDLISGLPGMINFAGRLERSLE